MLRNARLRHRLLDLLSGSRLEGLFADASAPPPLGFESRADFFNALRDNLWAQLRGLGANSIVDEIEGIAEELGVPSCEVALLHLMYEAEGGGCTSVILPRHQGEIFASSGQFQAPLFGRVLDWDFAELLRPLTIQVKLVKGREVVLEMLTFAGFVGCLTGRRPGVCAAAINYRRPLDGNFEGEARLQEPPSPESPAWPPALLLRSVMQAPDEKCFSEMVQMLSDSKLWAPCYFCLSGPESLDGVVISRESGSTSAGSLLAATHHRLEKSEGCLVQTNADLPKLADLYEANDSSEDFMASKQRYNVVRHVLSSKNHETSEKTHAYVTQNSQKELLWKALATSPVIDSASVHACVFGATVAIESAVLRMEHLRPSGDRGLSTECERLMGSRSCAALYYAILIALVATLFRYYTSTHHTEF